MADVDPKVAQRVFKDYSRGLHVPDIVERHGVTSRAVSQIVKFEQAVQARVRQALAKAQARTGPTAPKVGKPKAVPGGKR
jgi:hypothetical protein